MLSSTHAVKLLAAAFLDGDWTISGLESRGRVGLGLRKPSKWFGWLCARVGEISPERPSSHRLESILSNIISSRGLSERLARLKRASMLNLPRPTMSPRSEWAAALPIPKLVTAGELADLLEITPGELDWFADRYRLADGVPAGPLQHYRYRLLPKSSGRARLLEVPKPRLMQIQRTILHHILDHISPHPAAHAYRSGKSIATYVAPHTGQRIVVHLDLREFFPSLRASRVAALFRTVGYPDRVAGLLAALCTHRTRREAFGTEESGYFDLAARRLYRERHLPQGAPTSPALANLCARRLDVRLSGLAERFSATYTRYADDLLFSGGTDLEQGKTRLLNHSLMIAHSEGFAIRSSKSRIMLNSQSQRVAGVTLNEHPNLARDDFDQLKALLFNCVRHGPESQNRDNKANFAQHLKGRIAYISMINPTRGAKLNAMFHQIDWQNRE